LAELATRPPRRVDDDADAPRLRTRARAGRGDLQHLFGDRALLERTFLGSPTVTRLALDDTLEHTRVQFSLRADEEWAHLTDLERLVAVDRRALDEGTSNEDAGTVDPYDYAVLFELDRLRSARQAKPPSHLRTYDVVFVDEAQEFAPLELALIGRSMAVGGAL